MPEQATDKGAEAIPTGHSQNSRYFGNNFIPNYKHPNHQNWWMQRNEQQANDAAELQYYRGMQAATAAAAATNATAAATANAAPAAAADAASAAQAPAAQAPMPGYVTFAAQPPAQPPAGQQIAPPQQQYDQYVQQKGGKGKGGGKGPPAANKTKAKPPAEPKQRTNLWGGITQSTGTAVIDSKTLTVS
jgi:hypothetical protein